MRSTMGPYSMFFLPLFLIACGEDGEDLLPPTGPVGSARITVTTTGLDPDPDGYRVEVDGVGRATMPANGSALLVLAPGSRRIGLSGLAPNCTIDGPATQAVTVSSGGLIRDTVEVTFAVTCVRAFATLQIIARTTGTIPQSKYTVWGCSFSVTYCWEFLVGPLGRLAPNDSLVARVPLNVHRVHLTNLPANCSAQSPNPSPIFWLTAGSTGRIGFSVACSP